MHVYREVGRPTASLLYLYLASTPCIQPVCAVYMSSCILLMMDLMGEGACILLLQLQILGLQAPGSPGFTALP